MTPLQALFRCGHDNRISRIYSDGWDNNIEAWAEEVAENFADICRHFGDDPESCQLAGEAKWVWLRFSEPGRAFIREEEFRGADRVTMIRVHRIRGKRKPA